MQLNALEVELTELRGSPMLSAGQGRAELEANNERSMRIECERMLEVVTGSMLRLSRPLTVSMHVFDTQVAKEHEDAFSRAVFPPSGIPTSRLSQPFPRLRVSARKGARGSRGRSLEQPTLSPSATHSALRLGGEAAREHCLQLQEKLHEAEGYGKKLQRLVTEQEARSSVSHRPWGTLSQTAALMAGSSVKHAEAGAKAAIDKAIEAEAEGMRLKMLLERERRGRGTTEAPDTLTTEPRGARDPRPETQSPERWRNSSRRYGTPIS